MAKPDKLNVIWASSGVSVDPDSVTPGTVELGWVAEIPPYQYFNYILNKHAQMLDHVNTYGIPQWDGDTTYLKGSRTIYDEQTYRCMVTSSKGATPDTSSDWKSMDDYVNELIAINVNQPVKTTSSPTFANATIGGKSINTTLTGLRDDVDDNAFALGSLEGKVGQSLNTTNTPTFADINITGLTGTVEGRIETNTSDINSIESDISNIESDVLNNTSGIIANASAISQLTLDTNANSGDIANLESLVPLVFSASTSAGNYTSNSTIAVPKGTYTYYFDMSSDDGGVTVQRYCGGDWVEIWREYQSDDDPSITVALPFPIISTASGEGAHRILLTADSDYPITVHRVRL